MPMMLRVKDVFTEQELKQGLSLWEDDQKNFHNRALEEIIRPAMPRINKSTGQENSANYMAYLLEYLVSTRR